MKFFYYFCVQSNNRQHYAQRKRRYLYYSDVSYGFLPREAMLPWYMYSPLSVYVHLSLFLPQVGVILKWLNVETHHHGLRGSASPVLTATGLVTLSVAIFEPHRIHTP